MAEGRLTFVTQALLRALDRGVDISQRAHFELLHERIVLLFTHVAMGRVERFEGMVQASRAVECCIDGRMVGKVFSVVVGSLPYFFDGAVDVGDRVFLVPLGLTVAAGSLQVSARKTKIRQGVKKRGMFAFPALLVLFRRFVCGCMSRREGCERDRAGQKGSEKRFHGRNRIAAARDSQNGAVFARDIGVAPSPDVAASVAKLSPLNSINSELRTAMGQARFYRPGHRTNFPAHCATNFYH